MKSKVHKVDDTIHIVDNTVHQLDDFRGFSGTIGFSGSVDIHLVDYA